MNRCIRKYVLILILVVISLTVHSLLKMDDFRYGTLSEYSLRYLGQTRRSKPSTETKTNSSKMPSLIKFTPIVYNKNIDNDTYDNVGEFPCTQLQPATDKDIEDLMCFSRPKFLPELKNPCFVDEVGSLQCLPYYFLLAFNKCGTTDFYFRLTSHKSILRNNGSSEKELFYWSWRRYGLFRKKKAPIMSFAKYVKKLRPRERNLDKLLADNNQLVIGDGTPSSGWDFRCWPRDPQNKGLKEPKVLIPHLMRHMLKDPKFIILVRDPVERLFSDYLFLESKISAKEFDQHVPVAIGMMNACLKENTTRQCFFSQDLDNKMPMRLNAGCYSIFLREWFAVFHRRHFLIIRTEDYQLSMEDTLQKAFNFLDLEKLPDETMKYVVHFPHVHATKQKETAGEMSPQTRKLLEEFYEPCNRDLAYLLKDDKFLWNDSLVSLKKEHYQLKSTEPLTR